MHWVQAKQGRPVFILQVGEWAIDCNQHLCGRPDPVADLLEETIQLKHQLSAMFKMTDMGILSYCLGIGVQQGEGWLQIQQC